MYIKPTEGLFPIIYTYIIQTVREVFNIFSVSLELKLFLIYTNEGKSLNWNRFQHCLDRFDQIFNFPDN